LANGSGAPCAKNLERGRWRSASLTEGTRSSKKALALTRGDGTGSIERKRWFRLPTPIYHGALNSCDERPEARKVPKDAQAFEEADRRFGAQSTEVDGLKRVSEARLSRTVRQPIKLRRLPLRLRASAGAALLSDPKPVARRQTRVRWRLDDRKVVRRLDECPAETPPFARSSIRASAGFPHG
jgi:hypothetical protein